MRITVNLSESAYFTLKETAKARNCSISDVVNDQAWIMEQIRAARANGEELELVNRSTGERTRVLIRIS